MSHTSFAAQIDAFHERASQQMGSDDFGDDDGYLNNLKFMLECADKVTNWTELGRQALPHTVVGMLCCRLAVQQGFAKYPDCSDQPFERPIIVTGVRSGTTALHRLLTSVPNTQSPEFWMTCHPRPRPPRDTWETDPLFISAQKTVEQIYATIPDLLAKHKFEVAGADENNRLFYDFGYPTFMTVVWDRVFFDWMFARNQRAAYARIRKELQLIGYGNHDKWVLKCPLHMGWIEETLAQFPGVTIVNTHRDPVEVLPSLCSLLYTLAQPFQTIDKKQFGLDVLEYWGGMLDSYAESRSQLDPAAFIDVDYHDIVGRPLEKVREIYTRCDGEFSPASAAKVAEWHAANPQNKHGKHFYTGEEYGLSKDLIREHTAKFCDYFSYRD